MDGWLGQVMAILWQFYGNLMLVNISHLGLLFPIYGGKKVRRFYGNLVKASRHLDDSYMQRTNEHGIK